MMPTDPVTDRLRGLNPVLLHTDTSHPPEEQLLLERILAERPIAPATSRRALTIRKGRLIPIGALALVCLAVGVLLLVLASRSGPNTPSVSTGGWHLVSFDGPPLRNLGSGEGQPGLQCVTNTVCYSPSYGGVEPTYRTMDGGQHWALLAPVPPADRGLIQDLHCANSLTCSFIGRSGIVVTDDGGARWKSVHTPAPSGDEADVWCASAQVRKCASAQRCTVAQQSHYAMTSFAVTTDGGVQWVTQPAPSVVGQPWDLTCDVSGNCLEVVLGSGTLNSLDLYSLGWPWAAHPPVAITRAAIVQSACPEATHCMFVSIGTSYQIITTSDAGATWEISGRPAGWLNQPTAVGCANGDQCWIAMSLYDQSNPDGAYSHPVIESTGNFGQTWHQLSLPMTTPPIGDVLTLSGLPSGAGCLAIGNGRDHFVLPKGPMHHLSGPILLSSLP